MSPAPAPPTGTPAPAPANTSFNDRLVSQTFTVDGAASQATLDAAGGNVTFGRSAGTTVSVSYDAARNSYSVSAGGVSQTFGASDIQSTASNETIYRKIDGPARDALTLTSAREAGQAAPQFVRIGQFQRNLTVEGHHEALFGAFTYGFATPAAAVPRTGVVSFDTYTTGTATTRGFEVATFEGSGQLDVDLAAGIFYTQMNTLETGSSPGSGVVGGGIEVIATGRLASGDGSFTGNVIYGGRTSRLAGTLAGRFYGPTAEELGASFSATGMGDTTVTGAFIGYRDPTNTRVNLTLINMTRSQRFFTQGHLLSVADALATGGVNASTRSLDGSLDDQTSGNLSFSPGSSNLLGGDFTVTAIVPSRDPNFVSYDKTLNGETAALDLYKRGSDNAQLALTYASLVRYRTYTASTRQNIYLYATYGLDTPPGLLTARTGTGRYQGFVYGAAGDRSATSYNVTGTSTYDVDFSAQSYAGSLDLRGAAMNGAGSLEFGAFSFSGGLQRNSRDSVTGLQRAGARVGTLTTRFFGPSGEELAGQFTLSLPGIDAGGSTEIVGATVAKRQ
ncbi:MAG: transferrin-binding protein-like solute binding protein [Sphingomonadaceae bacterium]|nr:transferrin-binding protein-like solute binding protein [Sphingomonadaceae bacterium]